jgi:hypothetical protein
LRHHVLLGRCSNLSKLFLEFGSISYLSTGITVLYIACFATEMRWMQTAFWHKCHSSLASNINHKIVKLFFFLIDATARCELWSDQRLPSKIPYPILSSSSSRPSLFVKLLLPTFVDVTAVTNYSVLVLGRYRVIQEESAILREMTVCVILSKKVHMDMGRFWTVTEIMVKRRYGPSCEDKQQSRNK